jgi:hypothetical protein
LLPLSSAPPRLVAVPSAQNTVAPSVSHPPVIERSSSFVTVRVPLPVPNVTWKVPSSGPSGLSAVEVCPTVSRSLPRNARLIGGDAPSNVAVTVVAALSVTLQVPVLVQPPPLQPVKVEPAAGAAVKVTAVPLLNAAEHVAPQEMPAGALVTVPVPAPALLTVSVKLCTAKVAVTVVAALSVTLQVPVPEQPPPLQPVKAEPVAGAAVKVTTVPLAKAAEHVAPHKIPAGLLVTVPVPVPALLAVSVKVCTAKVAVTVVAAFSVTVQVPVPEQPPPLQPVKVEPVAGAAVKVTAVPLTNPAVQVAPQEMPAGVLVTVPVPVPALLTVSVMD